MANRHDERFVVLGGGIVGLCVARRLAQLGATVTLVEKRSIGAGASGAAAGLLMRPENPESEFQEQCAESYDGYAAFLDDLENETGVPIEASWNGMYSFAAEPRDAASLRRADDRGDSEGALKWFDGDDLRRQFPALAADILGGVFDREAARVHPPDVLKALRASLVGRGVRVVEGADDVRIVSTAECEDGTTFEVFIQSNVDREVFADCRPVVCVGAWTDGVLQEAGISPQVPIVPVRGQMAEFECRETVPDLFDLGDIYFIRRANGRVWIGATVEDVGFDDAVTDEGRQFLLTAAQRALPLLEEKDMVRTWAGLRPKLARRGGALVIDGDLSVVAGHYRGGIQRGPRDADLLVGRLLGVDPATFSPFTRDAGRR